MVIERIVVAINQSRDLDGLRLDVLMLVPLLINVAWDGRQASGMLSTM